MTLSWSLLVSSKASSRPTVARRLVQRRRTREGVPLTTAATAHHGATRPSMSRHRWMRTTDTTVLPHSYQLQRDDYSTMTAARGSLPSSSLLSMSLKAEAEAVYRRTALGYWDAHAHLRCLSSLPEPEYGHDDFLNEEMERLALSCFGAQEDFITTDNDDDDAGRSLRNSSRSQQRQQLQPQRVERAPDSLDLELGEASVWDGDAEDQLDDNDNDNLPEFPKELPSAEWHRRSLELQQPDQQENLSPLDLLHTWQLEEQQTDQGEPSSPPKQKPTTLRELKVEQLKLECMAQREAVQRYKKATESTRSRQDYATLTSMQRLILNWFQPVRDAVQRRQTDYIVNITQLHKAERKSKRKQALRTKQQDNQDETTVPDDDEDPRLRAIKRYGPYLCSVDPEKMAVIAMHQGLTQAIEVHSQNSNDKGGISTLKMAISIGRAVEEEVLLQRVLKQTMDEERNRRKEAAEEEDIGNKKEDENIKTTTEVSSAVGSFATDILGNAQDASKTDNVKPWSYAESRLKAYLTKVAGGADEATKAKTRRNIKYAIGRARQVLNHEDWKLEDHVQVGAVLLDILLEHATVRLPDGSVEPAFRHERRWDQVHDGYDFANKFDQKRKSGKTPHYKGKEYIVLNDALWKMAVSDEFESILNVTTRHKPMVVPPKLWTAPNCGGYEWLQTDLVRFHESKMQREALEHADLSTVLDGLNVLGQQPWVINKTILEVAKQCWDRNIALGDIPCRTDLVVPPEPIAPHQIKDETHESVTGEEEKTRKERRVAEYRAYLDARRRYRRVQQKNRDMFSLRCSAQLKLGQAEQFKDYDKIYFPYNMDFRGRAYPVPPHLSNVGSDLCRGMLMFAEKKPLGKRGLFWLQVHLANLAGQNKMNFEQRAQYTIDNLENVRASVKDPFGDNREGDEGPWWMGLEDPFQGLATCHEIINAMDSGDPENYMCGLTVHMDGSCNGLQHYAALGRDRIGGTAVNLCDYDVPQDVYIGVMHEVIRRVADEAKRELDFDANTLYDELSEKQKKELVRNRAAKLVNGLIDRGVVKRTVMTSVYGVTYIGARTQIQEKIEEKLELQGYDLDDISYEAFRASGYLAEMTMDVIGELFSGARQTMNWLTQCARQISRKGYPVAWMTPMGLPAIQPYREKRSSRVVTAMHAFSVAEASDDLPIHKTRSVSAFPPNYVHSLDSSHMLLTALEMDRRGLSFSAVHDSFWTHACDVDEMNLALRDVFVELYSQPLLEQLKSSFELRYPDVEFPDLPLRGDLDLQEVKKSKFFFQ